MAAMKTVWHGRSIFGALVIAVLAGGCTGADQTQTTPTTDNAPATKGGTLVLGASQETACADWFAACGRSSWGNDTMASQTLPRAVEFIDGQYRPGIVLTGPPTVEPGPPQRVTYRIEPRAVWSDGVAVTSADFRYTWEQGTVMNDIDFLAIQDVDATDPRVAIVTWTAPAADWRDRFARILPDHLLRGKDRNAEMRNGYSFSAGPWLIDHWTRGEEIKLVRNPRYWGKQPNLDAVIFKYIPDAGAYLQAYKTGQLDMAFVQGAQPAAAELKGLPNTAYSVNLGLSYEALLFNTQKPPLDSAAVRQALGYAADRDAIVKQASGLFMADITPAQTFMSPANREWYSEPFKKYGRDLGRVNELMRGAGWAKDSDGIWAKGDQRAKLELSTAAGNARRELTNQILQNQWKEAGFETTINNGPPATVNGEWLPKGLYHVALVGFVPTSTDPGTHCRNFCSRYIPTEANGFQGTNLARMSSPAIDAAWGLVNLELDAAKRHDLVIKGHQILADQLPGLPIAPQLDIIVYNTSKVGGPVKAPLPLAFTNINEWFCKGSTCH